MRNKDVLAYLGLWEQLNNENFKGHEFETFENEAGKNSFYMSPQKWIKETNAVGIISKSGNSYVVHTDAIKSIIAPTLTEKQKKYVYAEEADVLNVALFGMTAKEWRENNPEIADKGSIRDYTDLLHLVILNNLENINAELIEMKIPQNERLIRLNNIARKQMELLKNNKSFNNLEYIENRVNNKQTLPL